MAEHPMADLRKKLDSMGLFEKPTAKSWTKVICLFVIVLSLFYAHANISSWGYTALLLPVTALFATALAMTGHEGIHASACKSQAGNMTLAAIVFPLFTGLSMTYWRQKHNVQHHAKPNVHNEDPDISQWPLVWSNAEYKERKITRFFNRHMQGYALWPVSMLVGHNMRITGIITVLKHPFTAKKKQRFNKTWIADVVLISLHFFVYFAVPVMLGLQFLNVLLFYIAIWSLVGSMLMAIFIVGHTGKPVIGEYDSNFMLQIETGRSIKTNFISRFFFVGLDKQIEHHLLPSVSHFNLHKIAPHVKEYAEKQGWDYEEIGFIKALWLSTKFVHNAWKEDLTDISEKKLPAKAEAVTA